jgi:hypothetical protein
MGGTDKRYPPALLGNGYSKFGLFKTIPVKIYGRTPVFHEGKNPENLY